MRSSKPSPRAWSARAQLAPLDRGSPRIGDRDFWTPSFTDAVKPERKGIARIGFGSIRHRRHLCLDDRLEPESFLHGAAWRVDLEPWTVHVRCELERVA